MSFFAYGKVLSCDEDLSAFLPGVPGRAAELHVAKDAGLNLRAPLRYQSGLVDLHGRSAFISSDQAFGDPQPDQNWTITVEGLVTFAWTTSEDRITYHCVGTEDRDVMAFWLLHIVLPIYLALRRECPVFHASAVAIQGRAVLFVAPSNTGKSTLAHEMVAQGYDLLSDDKIVLSAEQGVCSAVPSHHNIRPFRRDESLGHRVERFRVTTVPIHAVYRLERAAPDAQIDFLELHGAAKFDELIGHYLYRAFLPAAESMRLVARLASALPVYSVQYPADRNRLPEVSECVIRHSFGT